MYKEAHRASANKARLSREDQYALLKHAYTAPHQWEREQVRDEIERELRRETELAIASGSSLPLVLIRSALPRLDGKAAAKWAAALEVAGREEIAPKHFIGFLREIGGIEGAHHKRARLRKKNGRR
jgi:hypothetical protein